MIVKLRRKNARYPDLTPGQAYAVIGVEADDFRLLNDRGQPYLYPHQLFDIVDPLEPEDWVIEVGEEGDATPILLRSMPADSLRISSTPNGRRWSPSGR
jgi:hypothetical protein